MRIALAQILSSADPSANLGIVEDYTRRAADEGARLVLFPEATMCRFGVPLAPIAEPVDGPWASGVRAMVFVGDAMEESVDEVCARAGELGLLKVPVFMFQEGHDTTAEQAFREIARLTGGAWCRFDPGAAAQLRELLRAAAAYAAGGREALLRLSKKANQAAGLLAQMR